MDGGVGVRVWIEDERENEEKKKERAGVRKVVDGPKETRMSRDGRRGRKREILGEIWRIQDRRE